VLGIGECSVDEIVRVTELPPRGGKAQVLAREHHAGGQIATALLGCARLGHGAAFVGSTGDDASAERALAPLRAAGVDVSAVRRVSGAATRTAWICVEASGERTVFWQRDPRLALAPDALPPELLGRARVVLVDGSDLPLSLHAAELARAAEIPCVVDADAAQPGIETLLRLASHPVIPEALATTLFGSAHEAVRLLASAGAKLPVVTRGRGGAVAWIEGEARSLPAFAVHARDTTGAGDAFRAGIAHGILCGAAGAELVDLAQAVAAISCTASGAQGGLPTRQELASFLASPPPRADTAETERITPLRAR
jgi:sugar/nucleoside kinase (ribokinase family)